MCDPSLNLCDPNPFLGEQFDYHYDGPVGWAQANTNNPGYRLYFSKKNIDYLHYKIHQTLLQNGHNIRVTDDVLANVMSNVLYGNTPQVGDIFTRYSIPKDFTRNDVAFMNDRVVQIIVHHIINEIDMTKWNESLTVWTTVLGDFNAHGLRGYDVLKYKEKDVPRGQFFENY
jgi:hypothetical protein